MSKHYELRFPSTTPQYLVKDTTYNLFCCDSQYHNSLWLCLKVRILFIYLLTWLHGPQGMYNSQHDKTNTLSFVSLLDLLLHFIIYILSRYIGVENFKDTQNTIPHKGFFSMLLFCEPRPGLAQLERIVIPGKSATSPGLSKELGQRIRKEMFDHCILFNQT